MKSLLQLTSLLLVAVALAKELPKSDETVSSYVLDQARLPINMVAVEGSEVTIQCAVEGPSTAHSIMWTEFAWTPNGGPISINEFVGNHPQADRYTIIQNDQYEYSLRITRVEFGDGGIYKCEDTQANPTLKRSHSMSLTVVAPQMTCNTTIGADGIVLDKSYQTNGCSMRYQGGLIPNLTWTGQLPFNQIYLVTPQSIWTGMEFNVTREMDTRNHLATLHFTGYFLPVDGNTADNVPTYTQLFPGRQMFVYWGPTSMVGSPVKTKYEVGDVLTCVADAFPAATFFWQNMRTNQVISGQVLIIDANWQGYNQSMRCEARNTIQSTIYSNNIFMAVDVNVVTTPTTTLPPTTTTPPPAEAPCTDLSGAWVSTNPTTASLCIKIDPANRGILSGLLKNATDTYWVDIVGRSKEDSFDQVGFNGIWPADIGVSSFIGECHRCFGVEQLLVNVVSRNKGPPCGNPGWIRYTTQYVFTRSGTLQCPNLPAL